MATCPKEVTEIWNTERKERKQGERKVARTKEDLKQVYHIIAPFQTNQFLRSNHEGRQDKQKKGKKVIESEGWKGQKEGKIQIMLRKERLSE